MKKIIFFLLIFICSCSSNNSTVLNKQPEVVVRDTVTVVFEDTTEISKLTNKIRCLEDSLKFYRDSIPYDVYINARRIEKIKYYVRITEKNPNNKKFFYGWIRRAIGE